MRLGSESLQVLAGRFGVGHGEELRFQFGFRVEVGKAKAALRDDLRRRWRAKQGGGEGCAGQEQCSWNA